MTDAELHAALAKITHGVDGARLGTEWVNLSRGHVQCDHVIRHQSGLLCCALRRGHADGHRDGYVAAQPRQDQWEPRSPDSC